jgi:hypothetical protein
VKKLVYIFWTFFLLPQTYVRPIKKKYMEIKEHSMIIEPDIYLLVRNGHEEFKNWEALTYLCQSSPLLWLFSSPLKLVFSTLAKIKTSSSSSRMATIENENGVIDGDDKSMNFMLDKKSKRYRNHQSFFHFHKQKWWKYSFLKMCILNILGFLFVINTLNINQHLFTSPPTLLVFNHLIRLDQYWGMFAPSPPRHTAWFVVIGTLRNGSTINVLHPNDPPSFDRPYMYSDHFPTQRWNKYIENLQAETGSSMQLKRLGFGRYLCRKWNGIREVKPRSPQNLMSFKMYRVGQEVLPNYVRKDLGPLEIWHHQCYASRDMES